MPSQMRETPQIMVKADFEELLRDVEADPQGWSPLDLLKLLEEFGFEGKLIQEAHGWAVQHRYHPEHPDLDVLLYSEPECTKATARHVSRIIRESIRRTRPR
jgi:hypothetical protein